MPTPERPISGGERWRWGLCCQFDAPPPRFRTATWSVAGAMPMAERRRYLTRAVASNLLALAHAIERCAEQGIGAFRLTSTMMPLATHPVGGYTLADLDVPESLHATARAIARLAQERDIRLSFHPDQYIVLNSDRPEVVASALREIEHHAALAELLGVEVILLHGGSTRGGLTEAGRRLRSGIAELSPRARARFALENDDRGWSPEALLPICTDLAVPLVYDVHHHRCHADALAVTEATTSAAATWGEREPWVHLSSPRDGWGSTNPRPHADLIDPRDLPDCWRGRALTIDVEAKGKDRAIAALRSALAAR